MGNFSGNFNGPLDAANVLTGTLPVARLSDNVAFLNKSQNFPTAIATVDADGVALAAIQGLNQKVEENEARIKELEDRLDRLERLVNQKSKGVR